MLKVALIVWLVAGTLVAGIAVTVLLAVPSLSAQAMHLIAPVCVAAFVVGGGLSWLVAKQIMGKAT